ncbi:MAG: hypothetical protein OEW89_01485 [Gammaproteobacteria bacterium]|nr:hypothetical protein [Gammaproteobacteria bacterium]
MSKAAELSKELEKLDVAEGMELILNKAKDSTCFEVIEDAMCIMHDDGSVNIFENMGSGIITSEVISPESILKVLHHYRPFKELFKGGVQ